MLWSVGGRWPPQSDELSRTNTHPERQVRRGGVARLRSSVAGIAVTAVLGERQLAEPRLGDGNEQSV
jgi:hypothetical protein